MFTFTFKNTRLEQSCKNVRTVRTSRCYFFWPVLIFGKSTRKTGENTRKQAKTRENRRFFGANFFGGENWSVLIFTLFATMTVASVPVPKSSMIDFCESSALRAPKEIVVSSARRVSTDSTAERRRRGEERESDVVEKPLAVANSGQWPSGVQRVHSGLVLVVVVVVSSVARCGACFPAPLAPAE